MVMLEERITEITPSYGIVNEVTASDYIVEIRTPEFGPRVYRFPKGISTQELLVNDDVECYAVRCGGAVDVRIKPAPIRLPSDEDMDNLMDLAAADIEAWRQRQQG